MGWLMRFIPLLISLSVVVSASADSPQRFFKGNTHAHSLWSDGNDFPEMIIDYYPVSYTHLTLPTNREV